MLDKLGDEPLVNVDQAPFGALRPHRQMHHRRFAVAHVAGSVAALHEVRAVPQDVAVQMGAAAGAD
jgi:hypothetical protein